MVWHNHLCPVRYKQFRCWHSSLYNAFNKTDYTNVEDLEIVTLSEVIYMHQKNDVSIMFQNELALWEHQSTLNYNMPLRGLIYFAHNIDGILKSKGITLY